MSLSSHSVVKWTVGLEHCKCFLTPSWIQSFSWELWSFSLGWSTHKGILFYGYCAILHHFSFLSSWCDLKPVNKSNQRRRQTDARASQETQLMILCCPNRKILQNTKIQKKPNYPKPQSCHTQQHWFSVLYTSVTRMQPLVCSWHLLQKQVFSGQQAWAHNHEGCRLNNSTTDN